MYVYFLYDQPKLHSDFESPYISATRALNDRGSISERAVSPGSQPPYMGVSENRGTLFWGPYNKDPTISGTILGSPIFGNSHIGWSSCPGQCCT